MGKWQGPKTVRDPLLTKASHKRNRDYWITLGLPCQICGRAIDYTGPRYIGGVQNPRAFVLDHITPRYLARQAGWTEQQINALSNTRPSCQDCSNRSGAGLGQKAQRRKRVRTGLDTSRQW
jgi:hypothetical protein